MSASCGFAAAFLYEALSLSQKLRKKGAENAVPVDDGKAEFCSTGCQEDYQSNLCDTKTHDQYLSVCMMLC